MIESFDRCAGQDSVSINADICIVGAGAAGITLARSLMSSGKSIIILESGGADYEGPVQDLYDGDNKGFEYYDLRESRLRFFGGTTAIWGGRCAQFDEIDFEKRDYINHSGWPFAKEELRSYYAESQNYLGLEQIEDNELPGYKRPLEKSNMHTSFWQFDGRYNRFTIGSCGDLKAARNVKILLHASVVSMKTSDNGKEVVSVNVTNLQGGAAEIHANTYVLATGGLENPRLMLASKTKAHPQGIGNARDQVGRYFMEHPHGRGARIHCSNPRELFRLFPAYQRYKNQRYGLLFRPGEDFQRNANILNTCFTIGVFKHRGEQAPLYKRTYNNMRHNMSPTGLGRAMWKIVKGGSRWVEDKFGVQMRMNSLKDESYGIYTVLRAEQAPNPDSMVRLGTEVDALGMQKIELDWQLLDIDKRSVLKSMGGLSADLKALNLGRVEPESWLSDDSIAWDIDPLISNHHIGGYHHMGTTRMGNNVKTSVVDANCRVHGIQNLYIAGSSVFPTGGWANPTLTIIALAKRLGNHLKNL